MVCFHSFEISFLCNVNNRNFIFNDMADWIIDQVNENQIQNISYQEAIDLFQSSSIYLPDFDLIMISNITSEDKEFETFRILQGGGATFFGVHKVEWKGSTFFVNNLSTLKEYFFKFYDKLSFERCAFLILPEYKKLVRLKNIRYMLCIPNIPFQQDIEVFYRPQKKVVKSAEYRKQKRSNAEMFYRQKSRMRDSLLSIYHRYNPESTFSQLCADIRTDFISTLNELENAMAQVEDTDSLGELLEECLEDS